jgi:hypothetical protein
MSGRVAAERDEEPGERRDERSPQVRIGGLAHERAGDLGREFNGLDNVAPPSPDERGVGVGAEVPHPVRFAVRRLDEQAATGFHERDRERPLKAALAATDDQQHVRTERDAYRHQPADERVEDVDDARDASAGERTRVGHSGLLLLEAATMARHPEQDTDAAASM